MGRAALTLWYTVAALLGPGVCCCTFAAPPRPATTSPVGGQPAPTKYNKSCCHRKAAPAPERGEPKPEPGKPSKCPCHHGKQVDALPPGGPTTADLAGQLRLTDTPFTGLLVWAGHGLPPLPAAAPDTSQPAARPAGRDLLAAYSLLRC